jgi:UPF0716 family protein affecting phage T7 exclusion
MMQGGDNMPFGYWLIVILMLTFVLIGAAFAAKIGWETYLECRDDPDEYWGEEDE